MNRVRSFASRISGWNSKLVTQNSKLKSFVQPPRGQSDGIGVEEGKGVGDEKNADDDQQDAGDDVDIAEVAAKRLGKLEKRVDGDSAQKKWQG